MKRHLPNLRYNSQPDSSWKDWGNQRISSVRTVWKSKEISKGVPRQAEVAQGVPGRLRPRIFSMFPHYKGGTSSAKRTVRLYTKRNPWYSLSEAESISGHMVLSGVPRKNSPVTPPGIDHGTVRLVAQRLNHYATPSPKSKEIRTQNNVNTKQDPYSVEGRTAKIILAMSVTETIQ